MVVEPFGAIIKNEMRSEFCRQEHVRNALVLYLQDKIRLFTTERNVRKLNTFRNLLAAVGGETTPLPTTQAEEDVGRADSSGEPSSTGGADGEPTSEGVPAPVGAEGEVPAGGEGEERVEAPD
ncbi:hypothetical protein AMTR_s00022p00171990 [Amborella trichopoda]|uniref:Uncharacterized protein n=1 Tax=Amborella trichopoda TaxID=13333 RepID=W1PW84_AMBTC|nr:hypothetical protein AMTR_s00022p00171990 [Amborella trichopoda]